MFISAWPYQRSPTITGPVTFFLLMFSPSSARYVLTLRDRVFPHRLALGIAKELRAFQEILVIRIDLGTEVTAGIGPLSGIDVDVCADEADRRTAFVSFDQSAFCFVVEDRFAGELAQRSELDQQRSGLGRIRNLAARFPGSQIYVAIRQSGRRFENRQQTRARDLRPSREASCRP